MNWPELPTHRRWLEDETLRLVEFAKAAAHPDGGFGWLDDQGRLTDRPVELWITCRMTHVFALGQLLGLPGCAPLVAHGVEALTGRLHDDEHGGWFAAVDRQSGQEIVVNDAKEAYGHAFVVLAASSATAAGAAGARALLDEALAVNDDRFWSEADGMSAESWNRDFTASEAYRGVNANMHTVECYLAASDVTGDPLYLDRAVRVIERVVHGFARDNSWRIPEHFDPSWQPRLDYNADEPAHPFRPFGATIGHALEWARLTLSAAEALRALGRQAPDWMVEDAAALYAAGLADGWAVDDADGFVYTTDWDGKAVVRHRMHWVVAEAIGAAVAVHRATGDERYLSDYERWWDYVDRYLLDRRHGSWLHELDDANQPASTTWSGKPDVYHALQATLIPRLPLAPSFASALARGLLS